MGEAVNPTVSQVHGWQLGTLDAQATSWKQQATTLKTDLDGMNTTIGNSADFLVGKFGNGLRDKGLAVRDEGYKTVSALEDASTAITVGSPGLQFAQQTVNQTLTTLTTQGYRWADDGTVSLSLSQMANALSDKDKNNAALKLAALQRQADLYSTTLRGALHAAGVAAQGVTDGVNKAFSELPMAAQGGKPGSLTDPQVAKQQGTDDGKLVASGRATDADLQRIAARLAAAGITPDDVEAINEGKQVELSEAQWNYLHEFYNTAGADPLYTMTNRLATIGDKTSAASVIDQLNTLANPNVHSAGTDPLFGSVHPKGGLNQLPTDLRDILIKNYEWTPGNRSSPRAGFPGLYKLDGVANMMGMADSRSAPGSEINKAMLAQAAHIAPKMAPGNGGAVPEIPATEDLVRAGGADKIAVHDALTGNNLLYGLTGDQVLDAFTHRRWADEGDGVQKMLAWIGSDADSPDLTVSRRAGEAATGLASYVGNHGSDLLHLDGDRSASLGSVSPKIVEGIGTALSPYIPNLVGVQDQYLHTHGFRPPDDPQSTSFQKAQNIFAVIDTDKVAATDFNAKALLAGQQLQSAWTQSVLHDPANPATELATQSGEVLGLVDKGLDKAIAAQKDTDIGTATHGFADKGAAYDDLKAVLSNTLKNIPVVGTFSGPLIDLANAQTKLDLVGYAYSLPHSPDPAVDLSKEFPSARQNYEVANALQLMDGALAHDPQYANLFDDHGKLKGYDQAVKDYGNAVKLDGALTNILNNYRGGVLRDNLQDLATKVMEGRASIK
ncbi:TPR repeat region-containing protein [Nocardia niigatensis]